jgi:UDP:flavonoid glycosyltransferase YjiC (YdhE family)
VRVLCTFAPGYGHFHPMAPLALALEAAGHGVAFVTEERFCRRVTQAGFRAFPAGIGPGRVAEITLARPGTAAAGPEDAWRFGAEMFAGVAAPAKVPELVDVIDTWSPDLLVHDVTDFAGPVAAAHAGIPYAAHSLGPMFPLEFSRHAADLVAPLWRKWGVTSGPLGGMFDSAYLDICPPSLQSADIDRIRTVAHPLRPVPFDAVAGEVLGPWLDELPRQPTVYVTLGTLDNDAPGVIEAAVAGLRDEVLNVIVTVGPNREPEDLGPQPANVHVERYVPQSLLLPHCHVVVAHGGSGTTLAALAHGLPLLVLPQGANQYWNAERCAALGVGIRLLPDEVSPESVRRAVTELLSRPAYRAQAGRLAAEIDAMPAPSEVVTVLEALAASPGHPLTGPT